MTKAWTFDRSDPDAGPRLREVEPSTVPAGAVQVDVEVATVCQSDLHLLRGTLDAPTIVVMGHEGAGIVNNIGSNVRDVEVGDHVMFAMMPACGACEFCLSNQGYLCAAAPSIRSRSEFNIEGKAVPGFLGLGTFSETVTVPRESVVTVAKDISFEVLSLLSCSALTGIGSVIKVAEAKPRDTLAVIGCGGVGLAAIAAASATSLASIVAIDVNPDRLEAARELGATRALTPSEAMPNGQASAVSVDIAIDAVGSPGSVATAWAVARRGGHVILLGGQAGVEWPIDMREMFFSGKTISGSVYGSIDIRSDVDVVVAMVRDGSLNLEPLLTHRHRFDDLGMAVAKMQDGVGIRHALVKS